MLFQRLMTTVCMIALAIPMMARAEPSASPFAAPTPSVALPVHEAEPRLAGPQHSTSAAALESPDAAPVGALPESFIRAMASTYQTNPQIKAQRKVVEERDETVNQAFDQWLPRASGNFQAGRSRGAYNTDNFSYGNTTTKQLSIQQPIFNGGQTIATTHREKNQVLAARQDLRNVEQQAFLRGITAYMDTVRDRAIVDLSRNNVDVLRKQLQGSNDRFAVGEVTRTDVAQSEARLSRAEADAIQAEGNLTASVATFERVVGFTPETLAIPEAFPELPTKLDDAIDLAQKGNPNLLAANFRTLSAENDVSVNESNLLPDLSLQGTMTRQSGYGVKINDNFDQDSVTLNLAVPLYQSGAEYSRIRQAKSRVGELRFQQDNTRDALRESTIQSWKDLETSISTIRSTEDSIRAAQVALDGVRQEQLYGARTILDVLDAEQELYTARVNLVRAQHNRVVAIFTLIGQLGRLSPDGLGLGIASYNPKEHYDSVKYQVIGF